jgi:hypothetical protein
MAREMRFGEEAGRDIIRTVREVGRRMQNQPGTRARNRGYQQTTRPCVPVYYLRTGIGNITGSFTWTLRLLSDLSTIATGTFTIGTSTSTTIKTAIDTAIGSGFNLLISGTLPGTIEIHPNRGMTTPLYEFITSSPSLTPAESGYPAFVYSEPCCVVGG